MTIKGNLDVHSSKALSCDNFDKLAEENKIQGHYSCKTATDSSKLSNPSSSRHGLSDGAKAGIGVGVGVAGALTVALLVFLLWRRHKKNRKPPLPKFPEIDGSEIDDANMLGNDVEKFELEQPIAQMPLGKEAQELPGDHGTSEVGRSVSTRVTAAGIESRHEMPTDEVTTPSSSNEASDSIVSPASERNFSIVSPISPIDSR